ncbi:hypothetical protein [Pseudomonas inefficax]|uniref:hypothetical protein n=1 Tax=Pseudomonas inefficax TaxID=2078786 RepID=UPI0040469AF7
MSLESDVANLVTQTNALLTWFQAQKTSIAAAVAAAIAATPEMSKTFYINQLTGDDTNPGTAALPLKSIAKAVSNTPNGGLLTIYLQADYVHNSAGSFSQRQLNVLSDVSGTKRKLTIGYQTADSATYLSGFTPLGFGQVGLRDITLVLPSPTGLAVQPFTAANSLLRIVGSSVVGMIGLKLDNCEVQAPADFVGALMPSTSSAAVFESINTSYPSGFGGRYIMGVPGGTVSNTLSNVVTNLASL